ncbi:MAG: hypothetical protein U5L07_15010 [Desulfobacterales bacterium]|nr:hypothetical protein [Desulfobacterales bacterium]
MKKLTKILVLCVLATFVAGSAMAVTLSDDNTGDYLIFPAYIADGPFETPIQVINTSDTHSVVAKVVFRGSAFSIELLDFFIYLSPNDVWTGKLVFQGGKTYVQSDDDSIATGWNVDLEEPIWGDEQALNRALVEKDCEYEQYGYIEVFEAWNGELPKDIDNTVDKDEIYDAYDAASTAEIAQRDLINSLYGSFEINLPLQGLSASENAVSFKDVFINNKLDFSETSLADALATNADIEQLLNKVQAFMPYYQDPDEEGVTAHMFTFPTKRINPNSSCNAATTTQGTGPFWMNNGLADQEDPYCVEYGLTYYDLKENSPGKDQDLFSPVSEKQKSEFCDELNINLSYDLDDEYEAGWVRYEFEGFATPYSEVCTMTGAPVIPLVMNFGPKGMSLYDAAYEFGTCLGD